MLDEHPAKTFQKKRSITSVINMEMLVLFESKHKITDVVGEIRTVTKGYSENHPIVLWGQLYPH